MNLIGEFYETYDHPIASSVDYSTSYGERQTPVQAEFPRIASEGNITPGAEPGNPLMSEEDAILRS